MEWSGRETYIVAKDCKVVNCKGQSETSKVLLFISLQDIESICNVIKHADARCTFYLESEDNVVKRPNKT